MGQKTCVNGTPLVMSKDAPSIAVDSLSIALHVVSKYKHVAAIVTASWGARPDTVNRATPASNAHGSLAGLFFGGVRHASRGQDSSAQCTCSVPPTLLHLYMVMANPIVHLRFGFGCCANARTPQHFWKLACRACFYVS